MQYPYLTSLEAITLFLALFIGIVILYFLIRIFNKTIKFLTVLKAILLYELCAIIIYSIYPQPMFVSLKYLVLKLTILGAILFLIFYFITRKHFLIDWKKSLIVFFSMTLILFPLLGYFRTNLEMKLWNLSIFAEESAKMEAEMEAYFKEYGFLGFLYAPLVPSPPKPLSFKILGKIEGGIFSWPANSLFQIIVQSGIKAPEEKPKPYVKVIYPNGREKVEADQPFNIKWESKNIGTVNVSLLSSNDLSFDSFYISRICSKVDASFGYCQGTLKDFHISPYYKISVEGYMEKPSEELSYTVVTDESDNYFNILVEK